MINVILGILGLTNLIILFLYIGKLKTFKNVTDKHMSIYNDDILCNWEINDIIKSVVESKISSEVKQKVANHSTELINRIATQEIEKRLQEVSHELAEKYTLEHFEEEMRKQMTERIGSGISNDILGYKESY